jgi:hypothetical protein
MMDWITMLAFIIALALALYLAGALLLPEKFL